ncbi:hypothetical protein ACIBTP_39220 [Streptomyces avidinii]|jgi:hypothetical protein|uniref:hypothetical protein n=1 Tax=Streptomyces avidinii TaxID=1895 RepID=UPI003789DD71
MQPLSLAVDQVVMELIRRLGRGDGSEQPLGPVEEGRGSRAPLDSGSGSVSVPAIRMPLTAR